jgi:hypothetical protein
MSITGIIDQMCKERDLKCLAATHFGAAPLIGFDSHKSTNLSKEEILKYSQCILQYIINKKIPNVLIAARWDIYTEDMKSLRTSLLQTIDVLKSTGVNVYILKEVPRPGFDVPRALALSELFNSRSPEQIKFTWAPYLSDQIKQNELFETTLNQKAYILDPKDIFIIEGNKWVLSEGMHSLYSDNNHLSATGAMKLRPLLNHIFSISKK